MKTEAKTASASMGIQLMAVIGQGINKLNLNYDEMKLLVDKPHIAHGRLKALKSEAQISTICQGQYTKIERLDAQSNGYHREEDPGEHLQLGHILKKKLDDIGSGLPHEPCASADSPRALWVHRCDIVQGFSHGWALLPVFREAMQYHGPDEELWETLLRRGALWTVSHVLGVIRDEIHEGSDPIGLTEIKGTDAVFPVLLNGGKFGFLLLRQHSPIRQKRVWGVELVEGEHVVWTYDRDLIFFASDPRPSVN